MVPAIFRGIMNGASLPRRPLHLMLVIVLALLPGLVFPVEATAQRLTDYFELSYGMSGLSQTEVKGDEAFHVTIRGEIVCKKDLPVRVTEATIVGRVVAHDASGTKQTLNPKYVVTISPFPGKAGERFVRTSTIALRFPPGATSGVYQIVGELIEARIDSSLGNMDLSRFLPGSRVAGTVVYTGSVPATTVPDKPTPGPGPLPATPTAVPAKPSPPATATPKVAPATAVPAVSTTAVPAPATPAPVLRATSTPAPPPLRTAVPQTPILPSAAPDGIPVPVILILLVAAVVLGYLLGRK